MVVEEMARMAVSKLVTEGISCTVCITADCVCRNVEVRM